MFSFTTDLTQNHLSLKEHPPNTLFCWNQSMIKKIPNTINSIFKLRIINVIFILLINKGSLNEYTFEFTENKKISILLITRRVLLSSLDDMKLLEKKLTDIRTSTVTI